MAQSNNRFSYGGALGGLIAADETIQKELTSRLDNIQKAITNADMALDLNLAQKYRESGVKAELAEKQAKARKGTSEANVAERTEDSLVEKAARDVEHTKALTTSALSQAAEADARTKEIPATAAADRASKYASAAHSAASAENVRKQTEMAGQNYDLKRMEVEAKVKGINADISNQLNRIKLQEVELGIRQQQANTDQERADIARMQAQTQQEAQRLQKLMSVGENELNLARARALNAAAGLDAAKAAAERASGGTATGLSGDKLRTKLGYKGPEEIAGSVVNEVLLTNPQWEALTPGQEGNPGFIPGTGADYNEQQAIALRSMARDRVADAVFRYEQLATMGMVGVLATQDLRRVLSHTMQAVYPEPDDMVKSDPREQAFVDAQNTRLQSMRTTIMNSKNPAQRQALGQAYSTSVVASVRNLQENGFRVPIDLLFEFNLIQAQTKPLDITVKGGR